MAHPHPPITHHKIDIVASAPAPWRGGGKGGGDGLAACAAAGAGCTGGGCEGMRAGGFSPSMGRLRPESSGERRQTPQARSRPATLKDPSGKGLRRLPTEPQTSGSRRPKRRAETSAGMRVGGAGVVSCAFWRGRPLGTPANTEDRKDQAIRGGGGKTPVILYGGICPKGDDDRGDFF